LGASSDPRTAERSTTWLLCDETWVIDATRDASVTGAVAGAWIRV
jgi:hypothetical protein